MPGYFISPFVSFLGFAALIPSILLPGWRQKQKKLSPAERELFIRQKKELYQKTLDLFQVYVRTIHELATEYRYIFNHSDSLTEENETRVENMIIQLENTQKQIGENMGGTIGTLPRSIIKKTEGLLLKGNKRHLTSRDLLQHAHNTGHGLDELNTLMQHDLEQESILLKSAK